MKDSRLGESLWYVWEADDALPGSAMSIIYFTEGNVDVEHEVVKKALASSIQRDGVAYSLSQGYQMIDLGSITHGYIGSANGDYNIYVCNESGETSDGYLLQDIREATWVEVPFFD